MIHLVSDGAGDFPGSSLEELGVSLLPIQVNFKYRQFTAGHDLNHAHFYELVRETHTIPKTSLPSPGQIADLYRSIASKGDEIISIHTGSQLSGTYAVVCAVAEELQKELTIHPFDSQAASAALWMLCAEAHKRIGQAWPVPEILHALERVRAQTVAYFTVENLSFARMSGRLSMVETALASLLHVNPVIVLQDGKLEVRAKVRTRARALQRVVDLVKEATQGRKISACIVHAHDEPIGRYFQDLFAEAFPGSSLALTELCIPVAVHIGPGAVGVVAQFEEET